jgi:hypothetical protein
MKNKLKWLLIGFSSFFCTVLLNTPAHAGVSRISISIGSDIYRALDDVYQISPKYYFYLVSYLVIFVLCYSITKGEPKAAFGLSLVVSTITFLVRACMTFIFGF